MATGNAQNDGGFTLKGWHVFAGFAAAFGVIIAVNLVLAFSAVKTFPGLETQEGNGYVASQTFDDRRAAQLSLGWDVRADHKDGQLKLAITDKTGAPVRAETLEAVLGRATHVNDDMRPQFVFDGKAYVAPVEIEDGNWNIRLNATAKDGTVFTQRVILHVKR